MSKVPRVQIAKAQGRGKRDSKPSRSQAGVCGAVPNGPDQTGNHNSQQNQLRDSIQEFCCWWLTGAYITLRRLFVLRPVRPRNLLRPDSTDVRQPPRQLGADRASNCPTGSHTCSVSADRCDHEFNRGVHAQKFEETNCRVACRRLD